MEGGKKKRNQDKDIEKETNDLLLFSLHLGPCSFAPSPPLMVICLGGKAAAFSSRGECRVKRTTGREERVRGREERRENISFSSIFIPGDTDLPRLTVIREAK